MSKLEELGKVYSTAKKSYNIARNNYVQQANKDLLEFFNNNVVSTMDTQSKATSAGIEYYEAQGDIATVYVEYAYFILDKKTYCILLDKSDFEDTDHEELTGEDNWIDMKGVKVPSIQEQMHYTSDL